MATVDDLTSANWTVRRPVAFILLAFLGGCIIYLMAWATDDELRRSMVLPIIGNFGLIGTAYLGLPSLDLRGILQAKSQPQYVAPSGMVDQFGRPIATAGYAAPAYAGCGQPVMQPGTIVQPVMPDQPLDDRPR